MFAYLPAAARLAFVSLVAVLPPLSAQNAPPTPEVFPLESVGLIERETKHMGKHTYEVKLNAGQLLRFSLKVHGLQGTVTVEDPSGTRIARQRSGANDRVAYARIEFVANTSGVHRIHIDTVGWQPTGRYELNVEELLPADAVPARMQACGIKRPQQLSG